MILDAIIGLLVSFLTAVFSLFPAYSLPGSMTALGSSIGSALNGAGQFFPIGTLGICIGAIVGARVFILGWALVVWLYTKIPAKFT